MEITKKKVVGVSVIIVIIAVVTLIVVFKDSIFKPKQEPDFTLQVIHVNDFHARFEEVSRKASTCKPGMTDCIGGFSRLYSAIMDLRKKVPHSLVLSAGDNFQGTIWYSFFKWNVTQHFLNYIPFDAITLGNHEFDDNVAGVVPYIKALKFPVVVSNINSTLEPTFDSIYNKSTIVTRDGRKIGIIGVLTQSTKIISQTGKLILLDEVESVRREAEKLKLKDKCDIIIVVSHCGTATDRNIALGAGEYINAIVGGHTHSLYYHGDNPPEHHVPEQDYPYIVELPNKKKVFIVQSECFTSFVGHLILNFDKNNEVLSWSGNSIFLDTNMPKDKKIDEDLLLWKQSIEEKGNVVIGETLNEIERHNCGSSECLAGNFLAKTMIYAWESNWFENEDTHLTYGPIALMHQGGIRTNIGRGNITYQDLLQMIPFDDPIVDVNVKGQGILEALEYAVNSSQDYTKYLSRNFLQVDGLRFVVNLTKPYGSRIKDVTVIKRKENVYEPLNIDEWYIVLATNFLMDGGDGFDMFKKYGKDRVTGKRDVDVAIKYIKDKSPFSTSLDGRIKMVT